MNKKSDITDEERQLFRDAMEQGSKIRHQGSVRAREKTFSKKIDRQQMEAEAPAPAQPRNNNQSTQVTGTDTLSFTKPGLQHKKFAQLKQGKLKIDATLDLHEHTTDEAFRATDDFIQRCHRDGIRTVCIIHGKGLYSADNKPVLKNFLNHYLRDHPLVLAFHSAKHNRGGTGAVMVLLRS